MVIDEMAELQILRNQLNFLRAYLYTCREPIIEQFQKQMWPREYMYEHIHQYSISVSTQNFFVESSYLCDNYILI